MLRKIAVGLAALVAVLTLGTASGTAIAGPGPSAPDSTEVAQVAAPTSALEAFVPLGTVGAGVLTVEPTSPVAVATEPVVTYPNPGTNPVPVDSGGIPLMMSQDGADGEHASIAVSQAIRELVNGPNYGAWGLDFGETEESNATQTVFWLQAGQTRFRLVLTKQAP